MKYLSKHIVAFLIFTGYILPSKAQVFINQGKIEYEVKTNLHKSLPPDAWGDLIKDKLPEYKTSFWTLTFDGAKSIYGFEKWGEPSIPQYMRSNEDEKQYYYDFASGDFYIKKLNFGTEFNIAGDSIPRLNWKLVNENREIAGFNCRKAYAVLFDSVYVFAFYTEEILLPGGPQSFTGLPGTILGITVPRLYTSIIATKVEVNNINVKNITRPKAKKTMTMKEVSAIYRERLLKDMAEGDPEYKVYLERAYWDALL